jgi:hypothetical protein
MLSQNPIFQRSDIPVFHNFLSTHTGVTAWSS